MENFFCKFFRFDNFFRQQTVCELKGESWYKSTKFKFISYKHLTASMSPMFSSTLLVIDHHHTHTDILELDHFIKFNFIHSLSKESTKDKNYFTILSNSIFEMKILIVFWAVSTFKNVEYIYNIFNDFMKIFTSCHRRGLKQTNKYFSISNKSIYQFILF